MITPPPLASLPEAGALAIEHLTISYLRRDRALPVLTDVSFHIEPGEAYGLVGESGCGKTTVAMAVMCYLPTNARIEAGRIRLQGVDLTTADEAQLRVLRGNRMAMVYQDAASALNPSLTIGRQIAEVYRFHGGLDAAAAMQAAAAMLETVQIADPASMLRRYPHELSGGQQQRVMFAMALATNPDLLVLDEPTTGLDTTVEAEVLDLVARLRSKFSASILFISHNLGIVARMCERVGVLYAGRLIEEGTSREIFADPRHPYTLGLTRCVPNRIMRKDAHRLDPIPGSLPPLGVAVQGCVYAPRCPIARAWCQNEDPPAFVSGGGRVSRCFYHGEVPSIPRSAEALPSVRANAAGEEDLLRVERLSKRYGVGANQVVALDEVSIALEAGEILGLVGESGSGKSTLAKCVVGLLDPSGGRIDFAGQKLSRLADWRRPELRRKLQMVFQNPDTTLNPSHTARRILTRAARLLSAGGSSSEVERRVASLAAAVQLRPHHLDLKPSFLSGGLKQRVAIARAFAGSPALVLCDEPTSALDVSVQATILNLLVDLQTNQRVAYLFISHDLGVVRYLADRIAVMYLGQIIEIGPAQHVFSPPHHPYTEALLSAMPSIDASAGVRIKLSGAMPNPANPPSGCRFHTRCPRFLGDLCREREPPWQEYGEGHRYRCHIPPADLESAQREAVSSPLGGDNRPGAETSA
ncbi:MAG: ABC transporter ATP-binding protein [Hyphomicrobiales bacterium]|nr:ABC transporter ATP-binding protein [Hyphomicrobiales bacterium]